MSDVPAATPLTVGELATRVRDRVHLQGRMIMGIHIDGREVGADELEPVLASPAVRFERIDFSSIEAHDMVLDILRQSRAALDESNHVRRQVADKLAAGHIAEAMKELGDCLTVWSTTHEAVVKSAALLDLSLETLMVDEESAMARLGRIAAQLRALRDALAAGDFVLTADLMRYDMEETLAEWGRVITGLAGQVVLRANSPA